uniref:Myb-like DNA-binding domain containing protein n=1 Tax=Aureoumbra lagunensis TaxID=44058 RepID=A0A7S3K3S1_9STRA|mmetsp:Transcript_12167/g.18285  ORF Transcript_12167/g.18285 Transcript_12167/m.18285 type:complete len:347 (+) Transcript_12167:108-1148(+)
MTTRLFSEITSEISPCIPPRLHVEEPNLSPPRKQPRRVAVVTPSSSLNFSLTDKTLLSFESMNSLDSFISVDTNIEYTSIKRTGRWCASEDQKLRATLAKFDIKNKKSEQIDWPSIAKLALNNSRSPEQCRSRWEKVISLGLIKGPWSPEEDEIVRRAVEAYKNKSFNEEIYTKDECNWSEIAQQLPGRLTKQVRERWQNHLNPELVKTPWTLEEDLLLVSLQAVLGNRWNEIARAFHGRSENAIKNRWNSKQRRNLHCSDKKKSIPLLPQIYTTDSQQSSTNKEQHVLCCGVSSVADKFRDVCRNINFRKALLKASGSDPEISEAAQILITKVNRSGIITVVQQQ